MNHSVTKSGVSNLNQTTSFVKILSSTFSVLLLSACMDRDPTQINTIGNQSEPAAQATHTDEKTEVSFNFDFSAQLQDGSNTTASNIRSIKELAPGVMTGNMHIENMDTGETESRPWVIELDGSPFPNVNSQTAAALETGLYTFTLTAARNGQQYVGSVLHQISNASSDNDVPMTIRPVIGNTIIDPTIIDSVIDFGFSYSPGEISAAGLISPAVAISIDSQPEQFFQLNPATGLSDGQFFVNLIPGDYHIKLKFFDAGLQVGESVLAQELVTVTGGSDISMDIIPVYGEINFDFFNIGSDATFDVQVPGDVVDEAGGLGNLSAILRITGNTTPFFETPLTLAQTGGSTYSATATMPSLNYDTITYELIFVDITRGDEIGHCIGSSTLSAFARTVSCPIVLERRSVITGTLLSKLGVNVIDELGIPLPGAVVRIDGVEAGITGGSTLATPGYTRLNVEPGQRLIRAEFGSTYGEVLYDSVPLNVTSINLMMGDRVATTTPLLTDNFLDPQTGIVAPMNYMFGCNGQGAPAFNHDNNGTLELMSQFNDPDNDYCLATSAVTEHSFHDLEIIEAGGFQVSVDIDWSDDATSGLAIAIGEEPVTDPANYGPNSTADARVDVVDNEVVIRLYDNGSIISVNSLATGTPISQLENVTLDVQTTDFGPNGQATLTVLVNGTAVPPLDFTWDGGPNHIELIGGTTALAPASVAIDKLVVTPR